MSYGKFRVTDELKKAARGKKTKLPVGLLVYLALDDYPHIQKLVGEAFNVS